MKKLEYKSDLSAAEPGELACSELVDLYPVNYDAAGTGRVESTDKIQQRSLTGTAWTQEYNELTCHYIKCNILTGIIL